MEFDDTRQQKDYAVREVDFYYRVRGPPLSHIGTRRLKTGPADPTGPVSWATGWFRNMFQGKTKDKGKGFEVVRSTRARPPGFFHGDYNEAYHDDDEAAGGHSRSAYAGEPFQYSEGEHEHRISSSQPPVLPQVTSVGSIELPSRVGSRRTQAGSENTDDTPQGLSTVTESKPEAEPSTNHLQPDPPATARLPFSSSSSPSREQGRSTTSASESVSSNHQHSRDGVRTDRPASLGCVAQHRTNVHEASPEPSYTGNAAEIVDEPVHRS